MRTRRRNLSSVAIQSRAICYFHNCNEEFIAPEEIVHVMKRKLYLKQFDWKLMEDFARDHVGLCR